MNAITMPQNIPFSLIRFGFHKCNITGHHTVALITPKNKKIVNIVIPGQLAIANAPKANANIPPLPHLTLAASDFSAFLYLAFKSCDASADAEFK